MFPCQNRLCAPSNLIHNATLFLFGFHLVCALWNALILITVHFAENSNTIYNIQFEHSLASEYVRFLHAYCTYFTGWLMLHQGEMLLLVINFANNSSSPFFSLFLARSLTHCSVSAFSFSFPFFVFVFAILVNFEIVEIRILWAVVHLSFLRWLWWANIYHLRHWMKLAQRDPLRATFKRAQPRNGSPKIRLLTYQTN